MLPETRTIVAVKFGNSDRTYDYLANGFNVTVGQKVIIPMRGREVPVEVVEIKTESELASVAILRIAEPEVAPESQAIVRDDMYVCCARRVSEGHADNCVAASEIAP